MEQLNQNSETANIETLRAKKLKLSDNFEIDFDSDDYHLLINFKILKNFILANTSCVECNSSKMTLTNKLILKWKSCKWENYMLTSNRVTQLIKKQGRKTFEVNIRSIITFPETGRDHERILSNARLINMQGISNWSFTNINNALFEAYKKAADLTMQKACRKMKDDPTI